MGGVVFVGSMKGFEKRLNKAFATKVSRADDAPTRSSPRPTTSAETVAKKIAEKHHNHLPVVDEDGQLAGMVTRADALAALVATSSDDGAGDRPDRPRRGASATAPGCKSELGDGAELCAVVKADGYGHGADGCADAALAGGATRLAVATASRGRADRPPLSARPAADDGCADAWRSSTSRSRPALRSRFGARGSARLLAARARAQGRPARVHVKHDSGMGRLGNPDAGGGAGPGPGLRAPIPDLELAGVWTHFATADEPDSDVLRRAAAIASSAVAAAVRAEFPAAIVHAANSAAVFRDPRSHFDMARCGVADLRARPLSGRSGRRAAWPRRCRCAPTSPTSSASRPGDSRRLRADAGGRRARPWVGVLPLGYGDGVRRGLSNNAEVLVRRPAPSRWSGPSRWTT